MSSRQKSIELEKSVLQESFRVLKSNIHFCKKNNKIRTITITSCNPGEGKSIVAFNLAISMANSGIKVLLVDVEFRKQKALQYNVVNVKPTVLNDDAMGLSMEGSIKDTNIKNMSFLSIGSNSINPELFIESSLFEDFLEAVCQKFEIVIFDAPSLGGVIDSALISSHTDGTILVVQSGLHDYRTVLLAKEQLEKANAKILGVVLSKVKISDFKSYFKYQRYLNRKNKKGNMEFDKLGLQNSKEDIHFS